MKYVKYDQGGSITAETTIGGMTLTGPLKLSTIPLDNTEAVSKEYVDGLSVTLSADGVTNGIMPIGRFPDMTGALVSSVGTGIIDLAETGVTPGAHARVTVNTGGTVIGGEGLGIDHIPRFSWNKVSLQSLPNTLLGYGIADGVSKVDGVITGNVRSNSASTLNEDAVTKQYADGKIATAIGFSVGDIVTGEWTQTPSDFLEANGGLLDKTAYPGLYSVIGDKFNPIDFASGAGKPWVQQYDFNTANSGIGTWTDSLVPNANLKGSNFAPIIVTKDRFFIFTYKLEDNTWSNVIIGGSIDHNGNITNWSSSPLNLPGVPVNTSLHDHDAVVINNKVYLIGGWLGGSEQSKPSIYTAPINSNGSLGAWAIHPTNTKFISYNPELIVTNGRIYSLHVGTSSFGNKNIESAPINPDGTIGTWVMHYNRKKIPAMNPGTVVTKSRVYLLGGQVSSNGTNSIESVPINPDGSLGDWVLENDTLPLEITNGKTLVTNSKVYLFGRTISTPGRNYVLFSAPVNMDGTLGSWTEESDIGFNVTNSFFLTTSSKIYSFSLSGTTNISLFETPFSGGSNDYSQYYTGDKWPTDNPGKFALPNLSSGYTRDRKYYIKY